jgi:hypothetical protein
LSRAIGNSIYFGFWIGWMTGLDIPPNPTSKIQKSWISIHVQFSIHQNAIFIGFIGFYRIFLDY